MTPNPKPDQFGYGTPMQSGLDAVTPQSVPSTPSEGLDYRKLSPDRQIRGFYSDVLGREADTEGLNFWTNALNSGVSPESIRQQFLDSPEHRALQRMREPQPMTPSEVTVPTQNPMMPPEVAPTMPIFQNPITPPEVAPTMPIFQNPMTPPEVAPFDKTPEYGINKLYTNLLGREADPEGFKSWLSAYNAGMPLTDIRQAFLNSPEYLSKLPKPERSPVLGGMPQMPIFIDPTYMDDFMPRNTTPFPRPIGGIPQMPVLIDPMTPPVYGDQAEIDRKRMLNPVPYDPYNTTRQEDILSTTPRPRVPFSSGLAALRNLFKRSPR